VLASAAGLKLNAKQGKPITRKDVNAAFLQATGRPLTQEFMRDPSVVQMMGLIAPERGSTGAFSHRREIKTPTDPSTAITDRNMAARGLPVPNRPPVQGATRYSAGSASDTSRFGR